MTNTHAQMDRSLRPTGRMPSLGIFMRQNEERRGNKFTALYHYLILRKTETAIRLGRLHTTRASFQYLQTRQVFNKHEVKVAAGFYVNKYLENK